MKLKRFSLVAGVLALGVAACGDDVEIVQPTPEPPPPPPPVEATMAPRFGLGRGGKQCGLRGQRLGRGGWRRS